MDQEFGRMPDGTPVRRITLRGGGLTVSLLTLGAILQDVRLDGLDRPLTLGSESLDAYLGPMAFNGALVGPVANRIAGAAAPLDGRMLRLIANEGGVQTLHGGPLGTHGRVWTVLAEARERVVLALDLADGAEGYPGNRRIEAQFRLTDGAVLEMELLATTDRPTLMNLANHSYWNLGPGPTLAGHRLTIAADRYTPVDDRLIPTGVAPVAGTAFDLRAGAPVGPESAQGFDHNFCLSDGRRDEPVPALTLTGPDGVSLTMATTEPGMQVYDAARMTSGSFAGHGGQPYGAHAGVALEAQCWPDAPNQAGFPSIRLDAGQRYRQLTRWTFARAA